ncbi:MAG: glycoside hydrolase family 3 N-terminal domain-containing protein, partial [Acidimicrobiia bacterium]
MNIESLLGQCTVDEKAAMVAGVDMWHTAAVERLGIPALKMTDGPIGARGERWTGGRSAAFPCGTALGATWDPELIEEVGARIGNETRRKRAHVLLAPTVNIHRHPLAGRNFECYSEDPYLTARAAVAYITGAQSNHIGCSVKHLVANDSEFERMTISSEIDERTLREISLVPFEAAVRE